MQTNSGEPHDTLSPPPVDYFPRLSLESLRLPATSAARRDQRAEFAD